MHHVDPPVQVLHQSRRTARGSPTATLISAARSRFTFPTFNGSSSAGHLDLLVQRVSASRTRAPDRLAGNIFSPRAPRRARRRRQPHVHISRGSAHDPWQDRRAMAGVASPPRRAIGSIVQLPSTPQPVGCRSSPWHGTEPPVPDRVVPSARRRGWPSCGGCIAPPRRPRQRPVCLGRRRHRLVRGHALGVPCETQSAFATGMARLFLVATSATDEVRAVVDHHPQEAVVLASAGALLAFYAVALAIFS